jgi:methylglutaconyl-CoA hydratase
MVARVRSLSTAVVSGEDKNVIVELLDNGVATLALNRHKGKNSLSKAMIEEFKSAVSDLSNNKYVKVVVVKSNVEKVFCAGADLKERLTMSDDEVGPFVEKLRNAFDGVARLPMPTIAAIDGVALGGGLELALACDIRIAHDEALLGLPETALAIIPGAGGTQRLPRIVGVAKAKEMIFTGARLLAKDAKDIGLVSEVVHGRPAAARALEIASAMAEKGPIALRMAKMAIDSGISLDLEQALLVEKACYGGVVYTSDRVEGLKAFTEKRKPEYKGQ